MVTWSVMGLSFDGAVVRLTVTIEGSRAGIDYLGDRVFEKKERDDGSSRSLVCWCCENYFAAVTMISTVYCGAASLASTVARAGVLPGETQPSHTAFISWNVFMSVM